jgi:hypothetical protein
MRFFGGMAIKNNYRPPTKIYVIIEVHTYNPFIYPVIYPFTCQMGKSWDDHAL